MDFTSYFYRRAREARARAEGEPSEANRRAWLELAEIMEGRCLAYMRQRPDNSLN